MLQLLYNFICGTEIAVQHTHSDAEAATDDSASIPGRARFVATLSLQDQMLRTPLAWASLMSHTDTIMWLIRHGGRKALLVPDVQHRLPLHYAVNRGSWLVCDSMMRWVTDAEREQQLAHQDIDRRTPIEV